MSFKKKLSAAVREALGSNNAINQAAPRRSRAEPQEDHPIALEKLWQTHGKELLRVTQRITKNREDAEDALQDSFLRAHVHLHNFDGRSSLATWLTRIAINSALMILRKRANGPQLLSIDQSTSSGSEIQKLSPTDQGFSPEEQYAQLEQQSIVRQTLAALRPSIGRALALQNEERSIKEVAEAMGLSVSATKSRIFHAKAAMRKSVEQKLGRSSVRTKRLQLSAA
jgi:RNA polymerase sigma factor (sigma-70 family)